MRGAIWFFLGFVAVLTFGCSATTVPVSQQVDLIGRPLDSSSVDIPAMQTAAAMLDDPQQVPVVGRYRVLHGPTACSSSKAGQGNPAVHTEGVPIAGRPLRVEWTVNPTQPYDEERVAYLLVWFEDDGPDALPANVTQWGYRDCTLWAPLDGRKLHTVTPGSLLTQSGGRLALNWTPGLHWVGRKLYSQLVVSSIGANDRGWLLSPCLEAWVGNVDARVR